MRFPNSICAGTNSYNGTCLTSAECTSYGGTASGTCASGFGVCCIGMSTNSFHFSYNSVFLSIFNDSFLSVNKYINQESTSSFFGVVITFLYFLVTIQTCGTTTSLNNTYWQNSGFSSAYTTAGQCSLYVNKNSADIAQLRWEVRFTKKPCCEIIMYV